MRKIILSLAIESISDSMQKSRIAYTVSGLPASDSYRGIVILNGAKIVK